jgi:PilZ domain-containing protein
MNSCSVLIGSADVLSALKDRASNLEGELLAFTDGDALIALEVITKRRPRMIALERDFAATPRGTALINRIKADPSLEHAEIRVIAHDSNYSRTVLRPAATAIAAEPGAAPEPGAVPAAPPSQPPAADERDMRRAPRFKIAGNIEVLIDGNIAMLIDLSVIGAQVVSQTILKPNQRVRMALNDNLGNVRFNAAVAWASFEIPPTCGPRYRAGLSFFDADAHAVEAFCARHKAH